MSKMVKEVPFGSAIARIEVSAFAQEVSLDGIVTSQKVTMTSTVTVIKDGRVLDTNSFAKAVRNDQIGSCWYEKLPLDPSKTYTQVGRKAWTEGAEVAESINATIEALKSELAGEFETKTEAEVAKEEVVEEAKGVVAQAEVEGVENLLSASELKVWRTAYNNLHNEGGEGYIPTRVSRERYEKALSTLQAEK